MMEIQKSDTERDKLLIEEGKRLGIYDIIKKTEQINNNFKSQVKIYYKTMFHIV